SPSASLFLAAPRTDLQLPPHSAGAARARAARSRRDGPGSRGGGCGGRGPRGLPDTHEMSSTALGPAAAGAGWKPRGAAEWPPALAAFVARASEASAASARGSAARLEALEAEVARLREGFSVALMELAELRASSGEPRHDHDSPRISAHAAREAAAEAASCRGAAEAAAAAASEAASAAAAAASEAEA
ncbi:unnamed protein product, partial [Prorocentrum cordatum]